MAALIADLHETRWTGRPGYLIRAMVGMVLVRFLHALPTRTRTVRLGAEHAPLRAVSGSPFWPAQEAGTGRAVVLADHRSHWPARQPEPLRLYREAVQRRT